MRNKLVWALPIVIILGVGGYYAYIKFILPRQIASVILNDKAAPKLLPNRYEKQFVKSRERINSGADSLLRILHRKSISLNQLLKAIDEVDETEAYRFLEELNSTTIESSDQVFNIGKKYFKPDFDVEILRELFRKRVSVVQIKRAIALATKHRDEGDMSPEIFRSVIKQVLIEKEKKISKELNL